MGDRDILARVREPGQSKWVMSPYAANPPAGFGPTCERKLENGPLNASPGRELVGSNAADRGDDKPRRSVQTTDDEKLNGERRETASGSIRSETVPNCVRTTFAEGKGSF